MATDLESCVRKLETIITEYKDRCKHPIVVKSQKGFNYTCDNPGSSCTCEIIYKDVFTCKYCECEFNKKPRNSRII